MLHGDSCYTACPYGRAPSPPKALCWNGKITYKCARECPLRELLDYILENPRYMFVQDDFLETNGLTGMYDNAPKYALKVGDEINYRGDYDKYARHLTSYLIKCDLDFVWSVDGYAEEPERVTCKDGKWEGPWTFGRYPCGAANIDCPAFATTPE